MTGILILAQLQAGKKPNIKLKVAKGELTMSQYDKLNKRIKKLEKKLANSSNTPSKTHKSGWNWLKKLGITNGKNPNDVVTRQSFATMLKRYDEKRFPKAKNPSKVHKKGWDKLTDSGITNGNNPKGYVTREQFGTLLNRYNKKGNDFKK